MVVLVLVVVLIPSGASFCILGVLCIDIMGFFNAPAFPLQNETLVVSGVRDCLPKTSPQSMLSMQTILLRAFWF